MSLGPLGQFTVGPVSLPGKPFSLLLIVPNVMFCNVMFMSPGNKNHASDYHQLHVKVAHGLQKARVIRHASWARHTLLSVTSRRHVFEVLCDTLEKRVNHTSTKIHDNLAKFWRWTHFLATRLPEDTYGWEAFIEIVTLSLPANDPNPNDPPSELFRNGIPRISNWNPERIVQLLKPFSVTVTYAKFQTGGLDKEKAQAEVERIQKQELKKQQALEVKQQREKEKNEKQAARGSKKTLMDTEISEPSEIGKKSASGVQGSASGRLLLENFDDAASITILSHIYQTQLYLVRIDYRQAVIAEEFKLGALVEHPYLD